MNDLFLIQQTLEGKTHAFRFLVLRYQRPLFKFIRGFGFPNELMEEIVQECFVRAYKNLASYQLEKGASFSTWLFTIAKNLALNELEKCTAAPEVLTEESASSSEDSQELLEKAETTGLLLQAIQKLPQEFRSAVVLSCLKELSIEEVARIENCPPNTVKTRVFRGKQLLKALILPKKVEA